MLDAQPDITLTDLQSELEEAGAWFSTSALDRFMARHKLIFKKNSACFRT